MRCRENRDMSQLRLDLARQRVNLCDPVYLIPEKLNPVRIAARIRRVYLQHIAAHPERTSLEIHVIPAVLNVDQLVNDLVAVLLHARAQGNNHVFIIDRASQTIDTGNRCHNNHILPLRQRRRR